MLHRKWQLISHPDSVNPFLASLVNYSCTARVHPITVGNETLIDWQGVNPSEYVELRLRIPTLVLSASLL